MSTMASADPAALEAFAAAARRLAERQRLATRQFAIALDSARRDRRSLAAFTMSRALQSISTSLDDLASEATRSAEAFRSADRVLTSLGGDHRSSSGGGSWDVDVPMPAEDWEFAWRMPGLPFVEQTWVTDLARVDLEAGIGPRIEGGAGISVVDGVLLMGAELEATAGAWARAAIASGLGPLVARASGELFVGASASSQATLAVGRNGVAAAGEAGAFIGVKASGDVGIDLGPVGVGASGGVSAGVGANIEGDVAFGWDRVELRYDLGVALGLGFEIGGEWHVEPRELFNGVVDLGADVAGSPVVRGGISFAGSAYDTGKDVLGESLGAIASLGGLR